MDLDTTQVEAAQTAAPAASDAAIPASPESVVGTPATPAPAEAAVVETPAAVPAGGEAQEAELSYAEYNKLVEAQRQAEEPAKPEVAAEVEPAEEPAEVSEGTEAAPETPASEFVLTPDVPLEEFTEKKAAYLATVEITPELQAILDYQDAQIAGLTELEAVGGKDNLVKFGTALTRLFETEIDPAGAIKVNAAPLITELRTTYKEEFRPIMEEGLSTDSTKYQGATLLEEIMIDSFGGEKATKMLAYAMADDPLPITPSNLLMPQGLDDSHREAYLRLSEPKREQIQSLVDTIVELTEEAKDASAWQQSEIASELREKQGILDDEYQSIKDKQQVLNNERERVATSQRQQAEKAAEFFGQVATNYYTGLSGLSETMTAELAAKLDYADDDTRLSQARNIMTRIEDACSFFIAADGSFIPDPRADYHAKNLTAEGFKIDFARGRELAQRYFTAVHKCTALEARKANPQHLEIAKRELRNVEFDIKTEQKAALGQLSSKYVKSNAAAIGKQVGELQAKKQAVRAITNGKPETSVKRLDPKDEIARYNRELERQRATNGEQLFEMHSR